ncbi:hypothetical protein DAPPUDRAFT_237009 [Daphnia pulex]|uniref:Uncharacterized protein n=1 Tax=Daphnia pulex TaxID=6669 RepID=E9G2I3_DAPPU|nr:hypothetical protein DAPPUDRAFT_237009 [Daphnia pulex]|eukprot:EFX86256.1 hypothetical protein DAPPUDRAFT_237009 [Daphnia pulex]
MYGKRSEKRENGSINTVGSTISWANPRMKMELCVYWTLNAVRESQQLAFLAALAVGMIIRNQGCAQLWLR